MSRRGDAVTPSRARALTLLEEVEGGRRLDVAWESAAPELPPEDRPWVHEAVFGVTRLRGRIDHLLDRHLHRGLDSAPPALLRILRFGAYQLLYMGSVPRYAAVSQAVEQARAAGGKKAAGLVNAVLRALADRGGAVDRFPAFDADPVGHLSTWGSHPRWLVERWVATFGAEAARSIVEAGNRIPDLHLRPVGSVSPDEVVRRLASAGIEASPTTEGGTLRLAPGSGPAEALRAVPAIIQDPAAAAVVDFVRARDGDRVVDLCAAPGGKGVALTGFGAWVVGADPSATRLARMQSTLGRLGLPRRLVVARGERPPFRPVDVVLVDAPCTGTGTLARHPDARWRLDPDAPRRLAEVQARILAGAADVVRPGGLLVYSTCTIEPEENDGTVEAFLRNYPAFRLDGEQKPLRILPGEVSTDGAYAARMRRN